MAEKCPLKVTVGELSADAQGFIWDTGIPYECWSCINAALASTAATTEYFDPEIFEHEDPEGLDKYVAHGVKRSDDGPARAAIQEFGIDDGTNEGDLFSRTTVNFECQK